MTNQDNESTSSLEHFVQKKEQQQAEQKNLGKESQERLATKEDIQEILKRLDNLQMHVDRILDVM